MRNERVAGDLMALQGARRENILYGYSTDEQRSSSAKEFSAPVPHFDIGSKTRDPGEQATPALFLCTRLMRAVSGAFHQPSVEWRIVCVNSMSFL